MNEWQAISEAEGAAPPRGKVSFEAFLAWADEDTCAEWEDGEIVLMAPASRAHQELVGWLYTLLHLYVQSRQLGTVLLAPFLVRLRVREQGREPDLIFVRSEHLDRLHPTHLDGPADLIVEVVSPESVSRDRGRKYVEYEAEGVPEYWLLDPIRRQAEFYLLGDDGYYHPVLPQDGVYHSTAVAGFWLAVTWLWQEPLPDELAILRRLGVLP